MGLFSNLFKSPKGKVVIKFHEEDEVSVFFDPISNKVEGIVVNFLGYNQAICDYLGEDLSLEGMLGEVSKKNPSPSMLLREVLREEFENPINKNTNVLKGKIRKFGYSFKKVKPKKGYYIIYEGKFYGPQPPELEIPIKRNKSYYGTMSVLAFLQHIIDTLPQNKLNKFYRKASKALTPSFRT